MSSIKYSAKLLVNILAKFYTDKVYILSTVITNHCHLFFQSRRIDLFLFFGNLRSLINLNIFHCLLILLALLATSITYATNERGIKITAVQPVSMSLNSPNNLAEYLADLESESVLDLHYFLKKMLQLEADGYESNCIYGSTVVFNQDKDIKFYSLYHLLCQRCYQGPSFGNFVNHLIFNGSIQVIIRPLLEVMLKLCDTYKDMKGMTIGNMLVNVEAEEHTDVNIKTFLHYKANDAKTHYKNFYNENDASTKSSGVSWFSRYSQQLGIYSRRIAKNVSSLVSKAMYNAPFIGSLMSPVGASFTCSDGLVIKNALVCTGVGTCKNHADEHASLCCAGGVQGINSTTRTCVNSKVYDEDLEEFFVCKDNIVLDQHSRCDGVTDCYDGGDEQASDCCKGGEQGIDNSTRICENLKEYNSHIKELFVCKDNTVIDSGGRCNGANNCKDGSDEQNQASFCCEGGEQGFDNLTRICAKIGDPNTRLFVCKNMHTIQDVYCCNGYYDCTDGSDERINGINPPCFKCGVNNERLIPIGLLCNNVDNCAGGSDEGWHCPATSTEAINIGAYASGTALIVVGGVYVAMLVKYKNKKRIKGMLSWLLSPFTEPVRFLLHSCDYSIPYTQELNNREEDF